MRLQSISRVPFYISICIALAGAGAVAIGMGRVFHTDLGEVALFGMLLLAVTSVPLGGRPLPDWVVLSEIVLIVVLSAILGLAARAFLVEGSFLWSLGGAAIVASGGVLTYYVVAYFLLNLNIQVPQLIFRRMYPDVAIVNELLGAYLAASSSRKAWTNLSIKRSLMAGLEKAAISIEYGLPLKLRSGDLTTDLAVKQQLKEAATALRHLKHWVATPKPDSLPGFLTEIRASLVYAVMGEWDSLKRIEPKALPSPFRFAKVAFFAKAILLGAAPLIALFILQRTDEMRVEGQIKDYLIAGAFIWAAVTFISMLDPSWSLKLTALKDIVSILPLGGRQSQNVGKQ